MSRILFQRTVEAQERLVIVTVSGELDDPGLLRLADEVASAEEASPDYALLVDLRAAIGGQVTPAGVRALVDHPLILSPRSRRAVVVPTNLGFGLARMYEMLREDRGGAPRAFREFDEARRWVTSARG